MRSPSVILISLLLSAFPAAASAQVIRGHVVDEDRSPVSSAVVSLLSETEEILRTVETDQGGAFRLEGISPGSYLLRVERLGYETMTTPPLTVEEGSNVEVELRVAVDAIPLEPLVVRQQSRTRRLDPAIQAFYERREEGFGHFIDRQEIEERQPNRITQLLRRIPGVDVNRGVGSRGDVRFRRAVQGGGDCAPALWLDGVLVREGGVPRGGSGAFGAEPLPGTGGLILDEVASPEEIEGIELYMSKIQVPIRWSTPGARCGVVLIWTR